MSFELGGFAYYDGDIDGNEYDRECYNAAVAEDYFDAFYTEDYEAIGNIDHDFLEQIAHYYNLYNDRKQESEDLISGKLITIKNRTFIQAIIDNKRIDLIPLYIDNFNIEKEISEDLVVCFILNATNNDYRWYSINDALSNCIVNQNKIKEEYISRLRNIINKLEQKYIKEKSIERKKEILIKTKQFLFNLHWPKYIGDIKLEELDSNNFIKKQVLLKKPRNNNDN